MDIFIDFPLYKGQLKTGPNQW